MVEPHASRSPVILVIRDGWGRNPNPDHARFDAVHLAATPVADRIEAEWPTTLVRTSGCDVGLPDGTMGNSEVGHQNLGAGRIVNQALMRISRTIRDGSFFENAVLQEAFEHARRTGGRVHLLGLLSDGKVHSDLEHLLALVDLAGRLGFPGDRLAIHAITDGRDTSPQGGLGYLEQLESHLGTRGIGRVASLIGRFFAMDRDHRWPRIAAAYAALTGHAFNPSDAESAGIAIRTATSAMDTIRRVYEAPPDPARSGDEFIQPTHIVDPGAAPTVIADGDAVIFYNFRGDRPRQLTKAFVLDDDAWAAIEGGGFDRGPRLRDLYFATLTDYEEGLPVHVAFPRPPRMPDILGEVIAGHGLTQFRCAETEKFAHVTYFFNDYREQPFPGEQRLLVPSPRDVATYDLRPEMSAFAVCAGVLQRIQADDGEPLMVVNFANGDMVGHTGVLEAAIRAVECVDECVGRIIEAVRARGGSVLVTADHGNAEQMWDPEHECPHTAHTAFDVPLTIVGDAYKAHELRTDGRLGDVAPTLLDMMGLEKPAAMTGESLILR